MKTLDMIFIDETGSKAVLSLPDPKEPLTLADVQPVADAVAASKVFQTRKGNIVKFDSARIRVNEAAKLQ